MDVNSSVAASALKCLEHLSAEEKKKVLEYIESLILLKKSKDD
jgi:hypothetical protein